MEVTTKRVVLNPISKTIPENFLRDNIAVEIIILKEGFTGIGDCAFWGCKNLKTIYLPESLKTIEYHAFAWCKSLTEIEIPESLENIENFAFSFCSNLTKIEIPKNVKTIKYKAFYKCENLKEIIIDNTEEYVEQTWHPKWNGDCDAEIIYLR